MLLLTGSLAALPHVRTQAHVMAYAVVMGLAGGFVMVVFFSFWGRAYGRAHLGRIQGAAQILTVLASAVGPLLLAQCVALTGSYAAAFYALAAVVAALGLAAARGAGAAGRRAFRRFDCQTEVAHADDAPPGLRPDRRRARPGRWTGASEARAEPAARPGGGRQGLKLAPRSKLVMVGDSITDAGRARPVGEGRGEAIGKGYVMMVEALLGAVYPEQWIRIVNQGISGNTVRDLKARWQADVLDLAPDWVSVMIGANDVWRQFDSPRQTEKHVLDRGVREDAGRAGAGDPAPGEGHGPDDALLPGAEPRRRDAGGHGPLRGRGPPPRGEAPHPVRGHPGRRSTRC